MQKRADGVSLDTYKGKFQIVMKEDSYLHAEKRCQLRHFGHAKNRLKNLHQMLSVGSLGREEQTAWEDSFDADQYDGMSEDSLDWD